MSDWVPLSLREVDALVAEHVMGLKVTWQSKGPVCEYYGRVVDVPEYSVDLSKAEDVVFKLEEEGWRVEMGNTINEFGYFYWARFTGPPPGMKQVRAEADAFAQAVCNAALEVKNALRARREREKNE